jgi:uncharacterized protein (DUF1786 family)
MTEHDSRLLAIDVGGGTQDILLYDERARPENCVKMVLPAQTVLVARQIQRATASGQDMFLTGNLMGGGASSSAVRAHIQAGYRVYATPLAAKTIRDDLAQVHAMGVRIVETPPNAPVTTIYTRDVDLQALAQALAHFDLTLPRRYAIAVQDHGECLTGSQRRFRFQIWEQLLQGGGRLLDLVYATPPAYLTRMRAVQADAPGALVMDTAGAAIWGALQDERVASERHDGLIIVNVGNEHTLGVLLQGERIWGLFEQHSGSMNADKLSDYVLRLRQATLTNDEVFQDGGHGCYIHPAFRPGSAFGFVALTGPNWAVADGLGYYRAAPHGDMMIAGCFGLAAAAKQYWSER